MTMIILFGYLNFFNWFLNKTFLLIDIAFNPQHMCSNTEYIVALNFKCNMFHFKRYQTHYISAYNS